MKYKVLYIEDEPSLAMIVKESMEMEGFMVTHCLSGEEGLEQYIETKPDIIILDVMLPLSNGFSVATTIRNTDHITPIIFLTARAQVKDVVEGFESGGNDYLRKPFSIEELIIRMKVLLNTSRLLEDKSFTTETIFQLASYTFDSNRQILSLHDQITQLTSKESELLKLFCQNRNKIISKKSILFNVWGDDSYFHSRSLDVFVSKLRKHLSEEPDLGILNIRGVGYKFVEG